MKRRRQYNSTLPAPTAPLARSRIAPRNAARKQREFARAYHSKERVEFVKGLPCTLSPCVGASENAHTEGGGVGRKAGYRTIAPLCREHHRQFHEWGWRTFSLTYDVDLTWHAAHTEAAWLAHLGGAA